MDKQLHETIPEPCDIGKLDTTCQSGNISDAFILEPRDLVPFEVAWNWQKFWQKKKEVGSQKTQKKSICLLFICLLFSTSKNNFDFETNFSTSKRFFETLNSRLPLNQSSDGCQILPKRASDDSQHFMF